ncbi:MAG TPA: energy transducer TonB [Opitutaceae bacterium]|nr:energy transducer TonB [Opitutaceae bacterium]
MKKVLLLACFVFAAALVRAEKTAPKVVSASSPGYPEELTDTGMNGAAEVDIVVKADGTVGDAQLAMATHRAFGRAAMATIKTWRFEPAMQDGVAIDQKVSVPFRFTAPFEQTINATAKRKVFVALPETALTDKEFPTKKLKVKKPARPQYPRALAGSDVDEKVQVKFVVGPDGAPLNPTIATPPKHKEFESAAIQAVALMSYEPPVKDGKPVYVEATTTVEFENQRRGGGDEFRGGGGGGGNRRGGGGGGGFGGGGFGGGGGEGGGGMPD